MPKKLNNNKYGVGSNSGGSGASDGLIRVVLDKLVLKGVKFFDVDRCVVIGDDNESRVYFKEGVKGRFAVILHNGRWVNLRLIFDGKDVGYSWDRFEGSGYNMARVLGARGVNFRKGIELKKVKIVKETDVRKNLWESVVDKNGKLGKVLEELRYGRNEKVEYVLKDGLIYEVVFVGEYR